MYIGLKQMDEVFRPGNLEQGGDLVQKDIHIVYPSCRDRCVHGECVHGVPEEEDASFLASTRRFVEKVGCRLGLELRLNGSVAVGHSGKINGVKCGSATCACLKMGSKMGFWDQENTSTKESDAKKVTQEVDLEKSVPEKTRHANRNNNAMKPGWKKPPRPPRPPTDLSGERHMKVISDSTLLKRARIEKMRSSKKQKCTKPSTTKTSFWALLFTISFCVIMIIQGIFSQGSFSPRGSSTKSAQTSSLFIDKSIHDVTKSEGQHIISLGQISTPFSSSALRKYYFRAVPSDDAN